MSHLPGGIENQSCGAELVVSDTSPDKRLVACDGEAVIGAGYYVAVDVDLCPVDVGLWGRGDLCLVNGRKRKRLNQRDHQQQRQRRYRQELRVGDHRGAGQVP